MTGTCEGVSICAYTLGGVFSYVDAEGTKVWKPVCSEAVERVGIVDGVDHTDDVSFSDFGLEVGSMVGAGCRNVSGDILGWRLDELTRRIDDVGGDVLRRDFWRDGHFRDDMLDLRRVCELPRCGTRRSCTYVWNVRLLYESRYNRALANSL